MAQSIIGNLHYSFSIGDQKDFITHDNLALFSLSEYADNRLPTFELHFSTTSTSILPYLHEGNNLDVYFGTSEETRINTTLVIKSLEISKTSNIRNIKLSGMYAALKYQTTTQTQITEKLSSIEVITAIAETHFPSKQVSSNIVVSNDVQNWIQGSISDASFVDHCWLHSYIAPDTFLAIAIKSDGSFLMRDMRSHVKEYADTPKYTFAADSSNSTDIIYDLSSFGVKFGQSYVKDLWGYNTNYQYYDVDTAQTNSFSVTPLTLMSQAARTGVRDSTEVSTTVSPLGIQTRNVHSRYWQSYQHNLYNLNNYGSGSIEFAFGEVLSDVSVLDIVLFKERSESNLAEETLTGTYIVTTVTRNITASQYSTSIELSRESMNSLRGTYSKTVL